MEIKKILLPILAILLVISASSALAYDDDTTHPALTQEIIEFYNLSFPNDSITDEEREWIIQGSILEDMPPRWVHHFYDPINKVGWTGEEAGKVSAQIAKVFGSALILGGKPLSAVDWVSSYSAQQEYEYIGGNRSWDKGMRHYVDENYKEFYTTLGHVLHLLEDMGVPDHTRNDTHADVVQKITGDPGSPLEKYAARWNRDSINDLGIPQKLIAGGAPVPNKNRIEDYLISVAEYSNKYFFSKDTIDKYESPQVVKDDGVFGYGMDENGQEFELVRVREIIDVEKRSKHKEYYIPANDADSRVSDAYFSRLARQIVLHGAGVINLYKRNAKDEVVNRDITGHDILQNKNIKEALINFVSKPKSLVLGTVSKTASVLGNLWNVVISPVKNIASQIGGQADLPPEALREPPVSVINEAAETEDTAVAEENEGKSKNDAVSNTEEENTDETAVTDVLETPVNSPSPEEIARLQAQVNEAARQVENLRKQVQAVAPQAQLAKSNAAVFEEQEEEEEEELAGERVYDASYTRGLSNSNNGSSGGGGGGGSSSGGGSSGSGGSSSDTTAPGAITNLAVLNVATSSIALSWTAPGDDGADGTAASYVIRYATTTITAANWPSLTIFSGAPAPLSAGTSQSVMLTGFTPGTTYYFAIKSEDEAGNKSDLSNVASATTDLPIPDTSNVNHLLISEVRVAGADAGDEFIELYNPTDSEIDISGWSIQYLSGATTSTSAVVKKNFESDSKIGARSYFLIARGLNASSTDGYTDTRAPDMSHRTFSLPGGTAGATVFLVSNQEKITGGNDADIVDRLAYGSGIGLLAESAPAPLPSGGQSLERKAWLSGACVSAAGANEYSGNGCDTGNNSSDFEIRSAPNPQNLANLPETRSAPAILNLQSSYSSSTMSADFSWALSADARGATSTNIYTISKITTTSAVELFRASSTSLFSTPISEDTEFEFKVEDWEGLSRNTTTTVSSPFYSYAGTIWEQSQKDVSISANDFGFGGSHSWAQTFIPQRSGILNTVFIEWAPWNSFNQIVDGMESCSFRLYRAENPAVANETNLISNAIFFGNSSSGSGPVCIVGDFLAPEPGTYRFATTTITAGETYTFIFNYTDATHAPFLWGSNDVVPGSFWLDGVERPARDVRLKLSGIVTSPLTFTEPPTQPQNLQTSFDRFNLELDLSWEAASDPDSDFHYQINYTTSTVLSDDGWQSVGSSTATSIPLVYPNTYKVGVRARDDFYNVSTSTATDWSFPEWFTTRDVLASQLDNQVVVGSFGQALGFTVEYGQTFTVATTSVPYYIRLNTRGVSGGSCSVKIYAAGSISETDSQSPIAATGTLGGGGSNACDASSPKVFQFSSSGILAPGTTYIWVYKVQDGGGYDGSNEVIGGYNASSSYPWSFFYRHNANPPANAGPINTTNAYFELFGDLAE